ncbi:MAG: thiamine diphosphokinase [Bacteroidales bacterium]|nr:thiamine diphosphokinase [Bacteroidales bacterium]
MSKQNTSNATDRTVLQLSSIVILAAGDFPRSEPVLRLLDEADLIACCDSAAVKLLEQGRRSFSSGELEEGLHLGESRWEPGLIVGDMDSLPSDIREHYSDRMVFRSGQDDNDLTKTFHEVIKLAPHRIHILGATGRREDHTLGNISLLADYVREIESAGIRCEIDMVSDYGVFCAATGTRSFACLPGQEISIFAFDNSLQMKAEGLEYPLDGVTFDSLWKATLNRATGSTFTLHLNHPAPYLVFFCNPEF